MGTTTNYSWEYPDNGADENTWGAIHTTMVTAIDASLKTLDDAVAKVGDNETISGTWSYSNPITGASATADAHLITRANGDARYHQQSAAPLKTHVETVVISNDATVTFSTGFDANQRVYEFEFYAVAKGTGGNVGEFTMEITDDGFSTTESVDYSDHSANEAGSSDGDFSSGALVSMHSRAYSTNHSWEWVQGTVTIRQNRNLTNYATVHWDLVVYDNNDRDAGWKGNGRLNPSSFINGVRFNFPDDASSGEILLFKAGFPS